MHKPDPPAVESLDLAELTHLLGVQDGVVSRRQLLELNGKDFDIARMLRRKELVTVHPGVYVNHTGPLTWCQRAWAAVLVHGPAALARESALPNPSETGPIHVAIKQHRTVRRVAGVVAHRTSDFDGRVHWIKSPPRVTLEHAAIDVACAKADPWAAFRVLADVCQSRQTTASAMAAVLGERHGVRRKRLMLDLLDDLATGACSVLEREYLILERRHGLPEGERQLSDVVGSRRAYRDVRYRAFGTLVELDGRAFHDSAGDRDRDFDRDLETAISEDALTVRLSYGQVLGRGCRTMAGIATLLRRRGWSGSLVRCPSCPDV